MVKMIGLLMFLCMTGSGIASACYYCGGDIERACFWLILCGVSVILYSRENAAPEFHYRECNFFYGKVEAPEETDARKTR